MSASQEQEKVSALTTPGQAEGCDNMDEQSQSTPAPTTPGTAEGAQEAAADQSSS